MISLLAAGHLAQITSVSLLTHLLFNLAFVIFIIHCLYYRRSKRVDYYFTYLLISSSVFMIIFMLSGMKFKMGFALGLFAVFGIMKYRTISMPVREMTYLFILITMSVINALGSSLGWDVLLTANLSLVVLITIAEFVFAKRKGVKYIKYDRIDLCKKSKRAEMIADIEERFELKILDVSIGNINCLKDMALLKVYYEPEKGDCVDEEIAKVPREE